MTCLADLENGRSHSHGHQGAVAAPSCRSTLSHEAHCDGLRRSTWLLSASLARWSSPSGPTMWCHAARWAPRSLTSPRSQDPDYLQEFGPLAVGVSIFCFIWYFIMPYVHRVLERVSPTPRPLLPLDAALRPAGSPLAAAAEGAGDTRPRATDTILRGGNGARLAIYRRGHDDHRAR
jgi:hypothetical protein